MITFQSKLKHAAENSVMDDGLELLIAYQHREFVTAIHALRDPEQSTERAIGQLLTTVERMKETNAACEAEEVDPPFPMIMSPEKYAKWRVGV